MMMAYIHQNYTPFTNSIEQCADLLDYFSAADSVLSIEGGNVRLASSLSVDGRSRRDIRSHPTTLSRSRSAAPSCRCPHPSHVAANA